MAKSKNPLAGIAKFYEESVKKADSKGFADIYKQATEILFERLKKDTDKDLHFEDVEYLDGYFIFGYGTNSVVHFHIKEAPGWLGGIWWQPVPTKETENKKKQEYLTDLLECELFFQFEKEIDKFKPSASMFGGDNFRFDLKNDNAYSSAYMNAYSDLAFIIDEPYLAFYKEMHYSDFNHTYVSRESAKRYWTRHWKEKEKQKEINLINANAFMDMVKYIIKPLVENGEAFIYDQGAHISPRYDIVFKNITLADGKPVVDEPGCYGLFNLGYEDEKADKKLWKKVEKECAKRDHCKYYFHQPCHDSAMIIEPKKFDKWLKEAIAEGRAFFYKKPDGTLYEEPAKIS